MIVRAEILAVGTEPVVLWDTDEDNGLNRFTLMMKGWLFRWPHGGLFWVGTSNDLGTICATPLVDENDEPCVPSDDPPDIEHGWVVIAGYTIAELRAIAIAYQAALAEAQATEALEAPPQQGWWHRLTRRRER